MAEIMYVVVLVTAKNKKEARRISIGLIKAKLAACVNIIDKVNSLFLWKAKLDQAQEVLLLIKSRKDKLARIIKLVRSLHTYEVPEIIALPIIAGDKPYLRWIDAALR
ncbi:MAG TPA: divalent-cation tolerance protein CutA [Candidatus Omnitrophota bacterium]|nr:divalent-cation tolerance protein CutA [Candidatus Omnitrophota bacterium]HPT39048.1 divalent-cation tolerance protein CutA [Candidatus Omnitrophota bacterium]